MYYILLAKYKEMTEVDVPKKKVKGEVGDPREQSNWNQDSSLQKSH